MLQRYRLRLGDGTVLTCDLDGLRTWLTDGRATVQVSGTQEWRPLRRFLADEESAARLARALVPPEPRRGPAPSPTQVPPTAPPAELSIGAPPLVQTLAEETAASGSSAPSRRDSPETAHEASALRLKPLDDEPPRHAVPWAPRDDEEEEEEDQEQRHDRLEGPLLQVISTFGTLLSRCLDPLAPLVRGWTSTSADEPAPRPAAGGLTAWFGRLVGRGLPEPITPPSEPTPKGPPAPALRPPLAAPPPISELPTLRFAEGHDAREEGDVYEDGQEGGSMFPALWLWTRRVVLLGGLATAVVLVALNWSTWFPRAAEVGETVFTEIDRQAHSGQRAREQEQALRDATERLPHLAPETIRLVLATSSSGVLDPPEVFQLASEAADRGRSALTPAEAEELGALRRELLAHLRPPERTRVAEYDRARANRVVFPFENPHALELVARGARAMPPETLKRLQELLGKAVAAGLGPPPASP